MKFLTTALLLLTLVSTGFSQDTLEGIRIPTRVIVIFDNSGSMGESNRLEQAKQAFEAWFRTIPDDYECGLIMFNDGGKFIVPLELAQTSKEKIQKAIRLATADFSTPIISSLELAQATVNQKRTQNENRRDVVIIFTDGEESSFRGTSGVLKQMKRMRSVGIELIGIGFHGAGQYLKKEADSFLTANNTSELSKGLKEISLQLEK